MVRFLRSNPLASQSDESSKDDTKLITFPTAPLEQKVRSGIKNEASPKRITRSGIKKGSARAKNLLR